MLRQLKLDDMDAAARVVRTAFDQALPSLAGLHTPEEDQWFFRERVFETCAVWGAFDGAAWAKTGSRSPKTRSIVCSFGRSSAMRRPGAFTKQGVSRSSSKPTAPEMRRRSRTRFTSGPADSLR